MSDRTPKTGPTFGKVTIRQAERGIGITVDVRLVRTDVRLKYLAPLRQEGPFWTVLDEHAKLFVAAVMVPDVEKLGLRAMTAGALLADGASFWPVAEAIKQNLAASGLVAETNVHIVDPVSRANSVANGMWVAVTDDSIVWCARIDLIARNGGPGPYIIDSGALHQIRDITAGLDVAAAFVYSRWVELNARFQGGIPMVFAQSTPSSDDLQLTVMAYRFDPMGAGKLADILARMMSDPALIQRLSKVRFAKAPDHGGAAAMVDLIERSIAAEAQDR